MLYFLLLYFMSAVIENSKLSIGGHRLSLIRLANRGTKSRVTLSNYGCLLLSWVVKDKRGLPCDIVLGFDDLEDYLRAEYMENYPYFGVLVGRYANRIKDARFFLDGKRYDLAANKAPDHIHGGIRGFDRAVWEVLDVDDKNSRVVFGLTSPAGEEGYPGRLRLEISYTLTEDGQLVQEITGDTDAPTPINLTHHDYFNLNNGRGRIDDHLLEIPAGAYLEQDANFVVTGKLIPVEGTWHDFRSARAVGLHMDRVGGYDQTFVLDKTYGRLSRAAVLSSPESGLSLRVYTTEPVCHLYTGKWIPVLRGKNGQGYGPFSGLALEVQHHPNAVNIPGFPSTILRPGEVYRQLTRYDLTLAVPSAR